MIHLLGRGVESSRANERINCGVRPYENDTDGDCEPDPTGPRASVEAVERVDRHDSSNDHGLV
jgi:hypothetical protein